MPQPRSIGSTCEDPDFCSRQLHLKLHHISRAAGTEMSMRRLRDRKLDRKLLTRLAAVALVLGCAGGPAYGGSVTQPGETLGAATGAPAPPGVYLVNTSDWGCRSTQPKATCEGVTIPLIVWSTPWTVLGGRLQFALAAPAVEV